LNALSGTTDSEQEVLFVTTGESPYFNSFYKMLYRLLNVARRGGDLRVYKDGDLTFGVRAGRFMNGPTAVNYAGASAQALTDNSLNYIYITAAGVLTINQVGFPDPSATPHVPLATVGAGSLSAAAVGGKYDQCDITDYRGRAMYRPVDVAGAAAALTISADGFTIAHNGRSIALLTAGSANHTSSATAAIADGLYAGQRLRLVMAADGNAVTIKNGAKTKLLGDCRRNLQGEWLDLAWDGTNWVELGRSDALLNSAATGAYSHVEGDSCQAGGTCSHAEGMAAAATGNAGHAQGNNCTASGDNSDAMGTQAVAGQWCQHAHASGFFATAGDAQFSRWVLFGNTSGATPTKLTLDGNPAGATNRIALADNSAMSLQINIVAKVVSAGACSQFLRQALAVRQAGNASVVAAPAVIGADNNASAFAVSITADNMAHTLDITVTGAAGLSAYWVATVEASMVATGT
jgi:hypothetical protein